MEAKMLPTLAGEFLYDKDEFQSMGAGKPPTARRIGDTESRRRFNPRGRKVPDLFLQVIPNASIVSIHGGGGSPQRSTSI